MGPKHLPVWMMLLDWLLPEDPPPTDIERLMRQHAAPKPSLRTRIRDRLGFPRPSDEPEGFEWASKK